MLSLSFSLVRRVPALPVAILLASAGMLAGCSTPPLPDKAPTVQDVPFLGQQLTQPQIDEWHGRVAARREALNATLAQEKTECYRRFLVNRCLRESQNRYRLHDQVLRKQDAELNRQERLLREVDRQLRLQQKARESAQ